MRDLRLRDRDLLAQPVLNLGEYHFAIGWLERLAARAHVREVEQIEDELAHALGAFHSVADELIGVRVELAAVALGQQLDEAGDHAQRFLQVV